MARRVVVVSKIAAVLGAMFGAAAPIATASLASPSPGSKLWVARYNGPGNGPEAFFPRGTHSVAVSPDGAAVFVTGASTGTRSGLDYATIAYNATTGARLWVARYNGPANKEDLATAIAVGPGGSRVFVTGASVGRTSGADVATVAYASTTGAQVWVRRYNGPKNKNEGAISIAMDAGGTRVFVTGTSEGATVGHEDAVTIAYQASTGAQLWVRRYNGPANGDDNATSIAVSRGGTRVFVTGYSSGTTQASAYATVAYNAATGAQLWARRYESPNGGHNEAWSVAVSPNGAEVFVTGTRFLPSAPSPQPDYATIAYNAATGAQLWVRRYASGSGRPNFTESLALSPDGRTVFVTGTTATVAYGAVTGALLWVRSERTFVGTTGGSTPPPVAAVSANGETVFVAGSTGRGASRSESAAVAYNARTGKPLWTSRYDGTAQSVAVSPRGRLVVVNGTGGVGSGGDFLTVAYRA